MVDSDLAALYGVKTKELNKAVRRNVARFPDDFMFRLSPREANCLRFQFGTSKGRGGRRYLPLAFTEHGVAMLSGVLNSPRAVAVNIEIVRAFVRLRHALAADRDLRERMAKAEKRLAAHEGALGEHAQAIRSVFEDIRALLGPPDGPRRRIGF
ncbi:MAG: ORF6N domain-containing protein [Elusimicrobia bacterium]|nr:ORF6N domain-containing protein [Elusimicrobiota bacterium]